MSTQKPAAVITTRTSFWNPRALWWPVPWRSNSTITWRWGLGNSFGGYHEFTGISVETQWNFIKVTLGSWVWESTDKRKIKGPTSWSHAFRRALPWEIWQCPVCTLLAALGSRSSRPVVHKDLTGSWQKLSCPRIVNKSSWKVTQASYQVRNFWCGKPDSAGCRCVLFVDCFDMCLPALLYSLPRMSETTLLIYCFSQKWFSSM